ncbi:MAG TPA: 1,4-alpha-glucan branching protein GlgB [Acetobacteraceae bacterium]|nr:1,4-alpha-glucan branching protein GlgB [Acetobacteraceae bacterium]
MHPPTWCAADADIAAIVEARHADPFALLGPHETIDGIVIRAFIADADTLFAVPLDGGAATELDRRHPAGFFEGLTDRHDPFEYVLEARNAGGIWQIEDAYRFPPVLGPLDDYLLIEGSHQRLYERLGAHWMRHEGSGGVAFAVWAPHARRVSVVGDFNAWDGRRNPMRKRIDSGVWEIFLPGVGAGAAYKYEILGQDGTLLPLKADPFGNASELRPATASIIASPARYRWRDEAHMAARETVRDPWRAPMSCYEVHLGSWRRGEHNRFLTYDELAEQLVPYAADMGFTHLELLPITEHPLDDSWGYQPIGLFAPTRRFGDPTGFARFVDAAHRAGLGVILDWVPAHFPVDAHGLAQFDGTPLFEHADRRRGFHPDWNTAIYDYGKREVANYLYANALYWLREYHLDGLRVDAVASMLYLDYSRADGEWLPNPDGSNDNKDAAAFLRRTNEYAYADVPGVVTIAEESTSWAGVSQPTSTGGLGFGFKWNMGWMHDTLNYMEKDPAYRRWHHDKLTFGMMYAYSENFVLPLSHDEVVHGKRSLLGRMPGDTWQRFANLRAYYAMMWGYPGKKLIFMGCEFAQAAEWNFAQSLDWHVLDDPLHAGVRLLLRDLNHLYRDRAALYARDCEPEGFRWLTADDALQSVVAWLRLAPGAAPIAVVCNFTPVPRGGYRVGLPHAGEWREILNSDGAVYGGSNQGNGGRVIATEPGTADMPAVATVTLPPLATIFLEWTGS